MNTLITALLLGSQIAESEDSQFSRLIIMERAARHGARYAEAERLGREAGIVAGRLANPERNLMVARTELAIVLTWQGRYAEAIGLLQEELPVAMKISTQEHLAVAVQLGAIYRAVGRLDEAQLVLRRALRADGAGELPVALAARAQLARIEDLLGRRQAARNIYLEVLAEQTRRLGNTHLDTLSTLTGLIESSIKSKRFDEAEQLALRYLEDNRQAEAAGHPSNALGHYYLGVLDKERKRYAIASQRLHMALGILEAAVGRKGANVAPVLDALAFVEIKLGHSGAALELRREAVSIAEEAFGPRHRVTALMLYKHAAIQGRLHLRDEARRNKAKAIAIARESSVGSPAGRTIEWDTFRREAGR